MRVMPNWRETRPPDDSCPTCGTFLGAASNQDGATPKAENPRVPKRPTGRSKKKGPSLLDADAARQFAEARERTRLALLEARRRCAFGCGEWHYCGPITKEWPEGFSLSHDGQISLGAYLRTVYE